MQGTTDRIGCHVTRMLAVVVRGLVPLLLFSLLAACSGAGAGRSDAQRVSSASAPAAHGASPSASITPPAAVAAPQPCNSLPGAQARWLPMADGGQLEANTAGSGAAAVVFLHQIGRAGMCGFAPYAAWLMQHYQVQVVLVNRCGYGASECRSAADSSDIRAETEPAVSWARGHGARTVTLIGASGGGGDALDAAALVPGVSAVVDLSGGTNDTGANDQALARRVTVPALLAVAPDDYYCPLAPFQSLYAQIAAPVKRLLIESQVPGLHGWNLLLDDNGQPRSLAYVVANWAVRAGS